QRERPNQAGYIPPELADDPLLAPHPWHRWFARQIDAYFAGSIAAITSTIVFMMGLFAVGAFNPDNKIADSTAVGLCLFLIAVFATIYLMMEPLSLAMFGTTFGKFLFNIRIRTSQGEKLSIGQAIGRTFMVFIFGGQAVGFIPFIGWLFHIWLAIHQYLELTKHGIVSWDKNAGYRYEHRPMGAGRWVAIGVLTVCWFVLTLCYVLYHLVSTMSKGS
ncbi:MAG TPA: RDD family protein, partial [Blastocatellia bacterium]|nr:RDD family protein [Blastocatellia bacterium]